MINEDQKKELIRIAIEGQHFSYAPYSKFNVSAALLMDSGKIYHGVNVENAAYTSGICAERAALFHAISVGERHALAIAVIGGPNYTIETYCPPCGLCRQALREFANPKEMIVILAKSLDEYKEYTLDQLLPESFGPEDLLK